MIMVRKILNFFGISQCIRYYKLQRKINHERINEERLVIEHLSGNKFESLSFDEKCQIAELWSGLDNLTWFSFAEFEMFKRIKGFDARYLTHSIYLPVVAHLLNDFRYTKIFEDKGLCGYIKSTYIRFPKCYLRRIGSDYYDDNMRQLTIEQAIEKCAAQEELFIKPSHETSGGKGAKLLKYVGLSLEGGGFKETIQKELSERKGDYVVQECIHQHPVMAQFNPTSVNTFRITTLMLNGKFTICSVILRFGRDGSSVDNWGAGGLLVHVNNNGTVNAVAHDINLNEYTSNGGCVFADCSIPQLPDILKLIEKCHRDDFAICKFIGWDIAINQDGNPVIIELNSSQPGVIGEQLVAGPIFGDRTWEVIDYCKTKRFSY